MRQLLNSQSRLALQQSFLWACLPFLYKLGLGTITPFMREILEAMSTST
jgi:hypothetical protein